MTRLRNLDLNQLVLLDALLAERSVTRAATRVGLSQPTLSVALGRLRRHFGDALLARSGNHYALTPLATLLRPLCTQALSAAERVFDSGTSFDPTTSRRVFTVMTTDYGLAVLGPDVSRLLQAEAPGASVRFLPLTAEALEQTAESLRPIDILLIPRGVVQRLPHLALFEDEWVCLVSETNARVGARLKMSDLESLLWVATASPLAEGGSTGDVPAVRQLHLLGLQPRVHVSTTSFLSVPLLIAGTELIAVIPGRLASLMQPTSAVRALACPFDAFPLVEAAWWHPMHEHDAGHRWFRQALLRAGQDLPAAPATSTG